MEGNRGNKIKNVAQNPYKRLASLIIKQTLLDYKNNFDRKDCLAFLNSDSYIFDVLNYEKNEKECLIKYCKSFDSSVITKTKTDKIKELINLKETEKINDFSTFKTVFKCRGKTLNQYKKENKKTLSAFIGKDESFEFETVAPPRLKKSKG